MIFMSSADCFQNQFFFKISFRNTIRMSNSLDPDQAQHFVGPYLGPNCLQMLSADDKNHQTKSNKSMCIYQIRYGNFNVSSDFQL